MRFIGRFRREASPSKVAVTPCPPTTPIIRREPVPALPKSSVSRGDKSAPSPGPADAPAPGREPLDRRAQGLAGPAGAQYVVALEQALDGGLAAGQEPEQESAMRNGLVARGSEPPVERRGPQGAQGGRFEAVGW